MNSPFRRRDPVISLILRFIVVLALLHCALATNVCICECCRPGQTCSTGGNSTVSIENCGDCTSTFCYDLVFECKDFLRAKCVDRDSLLNRVPNYMFLILTSVLLVAAILKMTGKWEEIVLYVNAKVLARFKRNPNNIII
eukprot:TRINITY_DN6194_c0_g1_i1.p1 TRINITY_DN6194_c0_g1~~TRINITY_DN6194_c0_g1_i1.p1  ORF type:complete len:140 (+),score=9.90 TRINITY_DN6194_c0_g1_i1:174-593(+)